MSAAAQSSDWAQYPSRRPFPYLLQRAAGSRSEYH
jgi:hypothetical protein